MTVWNKNFYILILFKKHAFPLPKRIFYRKSGKTSLINFNHQIRNNINLKDYKNIKRK